MHPSFLGYPGNFSLDPDTGAGAGGAGGGLPAGEGAPASTAAGGSITSPVTPPATPVTPPAPTTPPGGGQPSGGMVGVLDYARGAGHDVSGFKDDSEFLSSALRAMQVLRQRKADLQVLDDMRPQWSEFQAWRQEQAAAKQKAEAEAKTKRWHSGFKANPQFRDIDYDETNRTYNLRNGQPAPHSLVNDYQSYLAGIQQWQEQLLTDPVAALEPFKEEILAAAVERVEAALIGPRELRAAASQALHGNAEWMYLFDDRGRPTSLTPAGERYKDIIHELDEAGVSDPLKADSIAKRMLVGEINRSSAGDTNDNPAKPGATATDVSTRKKQDFLARSKGTRTTTSVTPSNGDDLKGLSLEAKMQRRLELARAS